MPKTWNRIVIYTKSPEPLYDYLTEQIPKDLLQIHYDDLEKLSTEEWYGQTLVIFDDKVNESKKAHIPIQELYIRGRKQGVSTIYLSQSYFQVPKLIRLQCNYVFIRKVGSKRDLQLMLSEYGLGATQSEMKNMYKYTCLGNLEDFMTIDLQHGPPLTYRKNFDEYLDPTNF